MVFFFERRLGPVFGLGLEAVSKTKFLLLQVRLQAHRSRADLVLMDLYNVGYLLYPRVARQIAVRIELRPRLLEDHKTSSLLTRDRK